MTLKRIIKIAIETFLFSTLILTALLVWGELKIRSLPIAETEKSIRLISMNVSADNIISESEQRKLIKSKADIIVVLEWTGDNLNLNEFEKAGFKIILNQPKKKVHGICILSQLNGIGSLIEAPIETPCTLPIGQFRFKYADRNICLFAVHAPPQVESCKKNDWIIPESDCFMD